MTKKQPEMIIMINNTKSMKCLEECLHEVIDYKVVELMGVRHFFLLKLIILM